MLGDDNGADGNLFFFSTTASNEGHVLGQYMYLVKIRIYVCVCACVHACVHVCMCVCVCECDRDVGSSAGRQVTRRQRQLERMAN